MIAAAIASSSAHEMVLFNFVVGVLHRSRGDKRTPYYEVETN